MSDVLAAESFQFDNSISAPACRKDRSVAGVPDCMDKAVRRPVTVSAGTTPSRSPSEFIVRTGRLEAITEGPPETLIQAMGRGDVVGKLALAAERESPRRLGIDDMVWHTNGNGR